MARTSERNGCQTRLPQADDHACVWGGTVTQPRATGLVKSGRPPHRDAVGIRIGEGTMDLGLKHCRALVIVASS